MGTEKVAHASRLGRMRDKLGNDAVERQANTKQVHGEKNCDTRSCDPLTETSEYCTAHCGTDGC